MKLLERLSDPDAVKAVSMDMSASFRPAVAEALPKAQIVVGSFSRDLALYESLSESGFLFCSQKGRHGAPA